MDEYIHTYTDTERERLWRQARYLAPWIFDPLNLSDSRKLLDFGCGSGAQMSMFLERYPDLKVVGLDRDASQLAAARQRLSREIDQGRVELFQGDTLDVVPPEGIDTVNLCWVLEHTRDPLQVLRQIRQRLPHAKLVCTEVFNPTMHLQPKTPGFDLYWQAFNRLQIEFGGNVQVGAHLQHLLSQAGYQNIEVRPFTPMIGPGVSGQARDDGVDYWRDLLLSAREELERRSYVTPETTREMVQCFEELRENLNGLYLFLAFQAIAHDKGPET